MAQFSDQPVSFEYFLSVKNGFVVASLVGSLENPCLSTFTKMSQEILSADFNRLVINFRDVDVISKDLIPLFALLQKQAREKEADLRICGLRRDVRERFARAGILRPHELADNLTAALQSMMASPMNRKVS